VIPDPSSPKHSSGVLERRSGDEFFQDFKLSKYVRVQIEPSSEDGRGRIAEGHYWTGKYGLSPRGFQDFKFTARIA
jgi:hypothetical protein